MLTQDNPHPLDMPTQDNPHPLDMIMFFFEGGYIPGVNGGVICHLRGQKVYDSDVTRRVLHESGVEKTF